MADVMPYAIGCYAVSWLVLLGCAVRFAYEAILYRRALARLRRRPKPAGPYRTAPVTLQEWDAVIDAAEARGRTAADGLTIGLPRVDLEPPAPRPVRGTGLPFPDGASRRFDTTITKQGTVTTMRMAPARDPWTKPEEPQ